MVCGEWKAISVHVIDAVSACRDRSRGNCRAINPGGEGATVEQTLKNMTLFQKCLHGHHIAQQGWTHSSGNCFQRTQLVLHRLIDLGGHIRNLREPLLLQHALHILAQHPTGVERKRPDAGKEDDQRENSHFCIE
jgi:hypothetical protein